MYEAGVQANAMSGCLEKLAKALGVSMGYLQAAETLHPAKHEKRRLDTTRVSSRSST